MVEATGFEPAASWSRTKRSTELSHTPILNYMTHIFRADCIRRAISNCQYILAQAAAYVNCFFAKLRTVRQRCTKKCKGRGEEL